MKNGGFFTDKSLIEPKTNTAHYVPEEFIKDQEQKMKPYQDATIKAIRNMVFGDGCKTYEPKGGE